MSTAGSEARRYPILFTQWGLLPVAVLLLAGWAIFASSPMLRLGAGGLALLTALAGGVLYRLRPTLLVDDDGYAIWERGREKLRVSWSEVKSVRADAEEQALYVDCGDPARNLLVPPRRGYGFRFERQAELYFDVLARVGPERTEMVNKLD